MVALALGIGALAAVGSCGGDDVDDGQRIVIGFGREIGEHEIAQYDLVDAGIPLGGTDLIVVAAA